MYLIEIIDWPVMQDEDSSSCEPLNVAIVTQIAYRVSPELPMYNVWKMHEHLWNCLKNQKIIIFSKLEP